jgi:YD repeat-containing protein
MLNDDNRFWHRAAWPTLFFTAIYLILAPIPRADGGTLSDANKPPLSMGDGAVNAWWLRNAFLTRPYGQMLWLPGYDQFDGALGPLQPGVQSTLGWQKVQEYLNTHGGGLPRGDQAALQLEDGSLLIFNWNSGRLLRRDYNDGVRKLDFDYSSDGKSVQIGDNLGRHIAVRRNGKGLIDRITDPHGFAFQYEYNAQDELATITDRSGGVRRLYYEHAGFPHYLTRMVIERGGGGGSEPTARSWPSTAT